MRVTRKRLEAVADNMGLWVVCRGSPPRYSIGIAWAGLTWDNLPDDFAPFVEALPAREAWRWLQGYRACFERVTRNIIAQELGVDIGY